MMKFISSNQRKIKNYTLFLSKFNVAFESVAIDLTEIQTNSPKELAIAKAKEAFNIVKEPLFVNDAGWSIPALNGFPGPYMKYVNNWFTSEDFLRLMNGIADRRIFLEDYFASVDANGEVTVFEEKYEAELLLNPQGEGSAIDRITMFWNTGKTISKISDEDRIQIFGKSKIWADLAKWITENSANVD